jgi:hypothetical protein
MRYLTIAADYTQSCLRDDFEGPIRPEALNLPKELCAELCSWNNAYRKIIHLDDEERSKKDIVDLITRLDQQGLVLAERVKQSVEGGAKIRYFSEGKLCYLTP